MTLLLCFHKQLLTLIYSNLGPVAAFRAAGDIRYAMTLTFFSMFTFRVGLSYLLCKVFSMDLVGVWIGMWADWFFRSILNFFHFRSGKWLHKKLI